MDIIFYGIYGGVVLAYISVCVMSHASQKRKERMKLFVEFFRLLEEKNVLFAPPMVTGKMIDEDKVVAFELGLDKSGDRILIVFSDIKWTVEIRTTEILELARQFAKGKTAWHLRRKAKKGEKEMNKIHLYNEGKCIRCGGYCDENNWTRVFHECKEQYQKLRKLKWATNTGNMLLEVCVECGKILKKQGFWVEIYENGQSEEFNRLKETPDE